VKGFEPLCICMPQGVLQVQRLPLIVIDRNRLIGCLLIEGCCNAGEWTASARICRPGP
jgi:hypothetical protein